MDVTGAFFGVRTYYALTSRKCVLLWWRFLEFFGCMDYMICNVSILPRQIIVVHSPQWSPWSQKVKSQEDPENHKNKNIGWGSTMLFLSFCTRRDEERAQKMSQYANWTNISYKLASPPVSTQLLVRHRKVGVLSVPTSNQLMATDY